MCLPAGGDGNAVNTFSPMFSNRFLSSCVENIPLAFVQCDSSLLDNIKKKKTIFYLGGGGGVVQPMTQEASDV